MKLLFDANISWRLTAKLKVYFEDCIHVDHTSLAIPAKDIEIWNYARDNNFIIVTNDDDFLNLLNMKGSPPKILLLRTGNQSNQYIEEIIKKHLADIEALNESNEYGLLELF